MQTWGGGGIISMRSPIIFLTEHLVQKLFTIIIKFSVNFIAMLVLPKVFALQKYIFVLCLKLHIIKF